MPSAAENKDITTAKKLVEKTKDLAQKIAEAKTKAKVGPKSEAKIKSKQKDEASVVAKPPAGPLSVAPKSRFADAASRVRALVSSAVADEAAPLQAEGDVMQQFNAQFEHFEDDAPACDICGAITVRNGNCHKCYNCGNSMGCS